MRASVILALPLALFLLDGCGGGESELADVSTSVCDSGKQWQSGNEGSPLMHPGADCIACHASSGGPAFGLAGTVFAMLDEPTDCGGVEGVVVQLTDANGQIQQLTSNAAGNFYMSVDDFSGIATPFNVEVQYRGNTSAMPISLTIGSCNSCHTRQGATGASGRIVTP